MDKMIYKVLADIIVFVHFGWILFMIGGFIFTIAGFFWKRFFDLWLLRSLHLSGLTYVAILAILEKYCPLTILENILRQRHNPELTYPGSFIVHYVEKLIYPDVDPFIIVVPTIFMAIFTIVIFVVRPPGKIKRIFSGS